MQADVADLVRGLAANFRPAIERLGLDFDVELDDLGRDTFVDVDMLERIVLNLLSNALKFTAARAHRDAAPALATPATRSP